MARFVYTEVLDAASRALFGEHDVSVSDQYGKCVKAGYVVDAKDDNTVRVSHRTPEPDLLDESRVSDDDMAAERHRMVAAYGATLEAAGWTVERKGPRSRRPYLLARR